MTGLFIPGLIFLFAKAVNPLTETPGFIGCYKDIAGRTITDALRHKIMKRDAYVLECINYCARAHYRYAGAKYHRQHMNCYCGNKTRYHNVESKCDYSCPGSGKKECAGAGEITLFTTVYDGKDDESDGKNDDEYNNDGDDENDDKNDDEYNDEGDDEKDGVNDDGNTTPIIISVIILVVIATGAVIFWKKWQRCHNDKQRFPEVKPVQRTATQGNAMFQNLPEISTSIYSTETADNPYNYTEITDFQNSPTSPKPVLDVSETMSKGLYDRANSRPPLNAPSHSNYNHIMINKDGLTSENSYSCTENLRRHEVLLSRLGKNNEGTYNTLTEDAHINVNGDLYNHAGVRLFSTNVNKHGSKEYCHLTSVEREHK
ncbi:uncharacterized protein LOC132756003 isoform X1 [Ruditapes philippinarum]|uniref:uncharacterized protein LOC132756003 isoform X1 n=2 Tax=Ruditapes philippinarum TaxID=129788 RepID=UPI00295B14D3|nr:uncharacterized protein LOC132756003 isoform X1 [Ruditapes philippinarum]